MDERINKLKTMPSHLLLDVVKNYKQHHYTLEIRDAAIEILKNRGIKLESLEISGRLVNHSFEQALQEYKKYNLNSTIALIFAIASMLFYQNFLVSLVMYLTALIFIAISLLNVKKISRYVNDENINFQVILVILSFIFYIIIFFIFRKQLKEKIQLIS